VARYLAERGEIAPNRLGAAGFGEFHPVAPNDTREGRARNRRVDLVVLFPQGPNQQDNAVTARVADPRAASRGAQP
jgi:hypothetical protein